MLESFLTIFHFSAFMDLDHAYIRGLLDNRMLSVSDDDSTYSWDHYQLDMVQFATLVVVLLICRKLFEGIGNSGLIGYLIGGIIFGPHALNLVPEYMIESITILGRLGVCLLILEAGLHMKIDKVFADFNLAAGLTISSMVVPIGLTMICAIMVSLGDSNDPTIGFAAGSCFAATSVGMSAKILADFNQADSDLGTMIITVAMIDDVLSLVLLSVVTQLAGDIEAIKIIMPIIGSIVFTFVLGYYAVKVNPMILDWLENRAYDEMSQDAKELQAAQRSEASTPYPSSTSKSSVHSEAILLEEVEDADKRFERYGIYLLTLTAMVMGMITATLSTELLGIFLAGVAFSGEPASQRWWHSRAEKVTSIGCMFFFCSLGFEVPLSDMLTGRTFGLGLLFVLPAVIGKTIPATMIFKCEPKGAVVGQGLACWGEIAFLMAKISYDNGVFGEVDGSSEDKDKATEVLSVLIWALLLGTALMPVVFPWVRIM